MQWFELAGKLFWFRESLGFVRRGERWVRIFAQKGLLSGIGDPFLKQIRQGFVFVNCQPARDRLVIQGKARRNCILPRFTSISRTRTNDVPVPCQLTVARRHNQCTFDVPGSNPENSGKLCTGIASYSCHDPVEQPIVVDRSCRAERMSSTFRRILRENKAGWTPKGAIFCTQLRNEGLRRFIA